MSSIYLSFSAFGKFSSEIFLILLIASSLAFSIFFFSSSATILFKRAFVASRLASVSRLLAPTALSITASFCLIVAELILLIAASFSAGVK